jgi:hypothetical protein
MAPPVLLNNALLTSSSNLNQPWFFIHTVGQHARLHDQASRPRRSSALL